jgi:hypothetical protein
MKRHFYGVYVEDQTLAGGLDLIRYMMEPNAVRFSHITVRGPYKRRISQARLDDELNGQVHDRHVHFKEPHCFFEGGQNTVCILVDLMQTKKLWYKPDYPAGVPHLTLYDGDNRAWAKALYEVLCQHSWNMRAEVSALRYLDENFKIESTMLDMVMSFTRAYAEFIGGNGVLAEEVKQLELHERLAQVQKVLLKMQLPLNNKLPRKRRLVATRPQSGRLPGL